MYNRLQYECNRYYEDILSFSTAHSQVPKCILLKMVTLFMILIRTMSSKNLPLNEWKYVKCLFV
jgi:hypothetical protein